MTAYPTIGIAPIPAVGSDAHLYVDPTGSDSWDGSLASPLQTVQAACERAARWTLLHRDERLVVHIANGTYNEFADFKPPVPPRRGVVFMGERDDMTIVESGTVTAGDTKSLTDAGKTWTVNQWRGRWCKVRTSGGTDIGLIQIRSNTATQLHFLGGYFTFSVDAGMLYEIVVPAVVISGFRAVLPWRYAANSGGTIDNETGLPLLDLAYLQFGPWSGQFVTNTKFAFHLCGGFTQMSACRIVGTNDERTLVERANLDCGYKWSLLGDSVFGIGAFDFDRMFYAGVWLDGAGIFGDGASITGYGVGDGATVSTYSGGLAGNWAFYGLGGMECSDGAAVLLYGDPAAYPVYFNGLTGNYAVRSKNHAHVNIENFELVGPFTLYGFLVDRSGHMEVRGTAAASGNIPYGIIATRLGQVAVGPATSFSVGTGIELRVQQAGTPGGANGTFVGLTAGTPLIGGDYAIIIRDEQ